MLQGILQAAGGLGLFLLGMSVMTDGLKSLADERLRSVLARSTRSPLSGVCTGAIITTLLQSSSATTVAAVGFVHAGLLTFPESLGIIFGANIGTTIKGWLVALIGFKMDLGQVFLPLILVGVLLRVSGKRRVTAIGSAVAGLGLVFVGIATIQNGMSALEGIVTPQSFPNDTIGGRLLLVLMGVAITLVTQSSSAGVAAALVAVHAGNISLNQAAAMVIGMDFGTTVTAAMATIGGNIQARRTGFAHVIYNAVTAVGAFLLLTPFLHVLNNILPDVCANQPELILVGFHTFFNTLGVIAILPFTNGFARLIERLFPDRGNPLVKRLDAGLLSSPNVALQAAMATLQEITLSVFRTVLSSLQDPQVSVEDEVLTEVDDAIEQTRGYLENIRAGSEGDELLDRYSRAAHVLDHLHRLTRRAHDRRRLSRVRDDPELSAMTDRLMESVSLLTAAEFPIGHEVKSRVQEINQQLKADMRTYRIRSVRRTAAGELSTKTALQRMDAARFLRRLAYHAWRISDRAGTDPADRKDDRKDDQC